MSLTIDDLFSTETPASFVTKIKALALTVGLAPSTWKANGIANKLVDIFGDFYGTADGTETADAPLDTVVTLVAKSGFLDTAADPSVTPDDGTSSWLDLLADSLYDESRTSASKATGPVTIANTGAAKGPFQPGTYHLVNATLKKTYVNVDTFTIDAATDTTTEFVADEVGSASTTIANALTPITSFVGVSVKTGGGANTNTLIGEDVQDNAGLVTKCRGKLQSLGPKLGPEGAYNYFATNRDLPGYPALIGSAVTRVTAVLDTYTGTTIVYLANSTGPLSALDAALVSIFLGFVCVPDAVFAYAAPAVEKDVNVTLTAYVPAANVGTAVDDVRAAISLFFSLTPIGGAQGPVLGLQRSALISQIFKSVPYMKNVTNMTFNGSAADLALDSNAVPVQFPNATVTVIAV